MVQDGSVFSVLLYPSDVTDFAPPSWRFVRMGFDVDTHRVSRFVRVGYDEGRREACLRKTLSSSSLP